MSSEDFGNFPRINPTRLSGAESFSLGNNALPVDLLSFWRWYGSNLMDNTLRGVLAEYIVAIALDLGEGVRIEWDAFDLRTPTGCKIEVKSSAYCQSWAQQIHSKVSFGIRPTQAVDPETNTYRGEALRRADIYVFALLAHRDKQTVNPLCLDQWTFYVVTRRHLDATLGDQQTLALSRLEEIAPAPVSYASLRAAINAAESKLGFTP